MNKLRVKMSASDIDTSETSNSPKSYTDLDSPFSSPSQQVPQITNNFSELTCVESNYGQLSYGNLPMLRIIEQPQNHFRFRYRSEMVGTHGCLLGKSYATNRTKTYPTVELINCDGRALIRCRLAQDNSSKEHPHKLLDEDQDRDVSKEVPEDGSYKVAFPGLGIIHTAKKDVPALLYAKYAASLQNFNERELRARCENEAKITNLNIVRLMFTANDINTGVEICKPVFSEPIHNMKSAATNDLKICRISRTYGKPRGGDDVFILVEKVNKKNIEIRFYELSEDGHEIWSDKAKFLQSDVHHQYAIVFRTPPYRDPQTPTDVTVRIELVRPSNGWTSDPKEFTYKAEQVFKQNKKRKTTSSYSSMGSSSGGSVHSIGLPATVASYNHQDYSGADDDMGDNLTMYNNHYVHMNPNQLVGNVDLGEALFTEASHDKILSQMMDVAPSPMIGEPNVPSMPPITLNSAEFERLLKANPSMTQEDRQRFGDVDLTDYFRESYGLRLDGSLPDPELNKGFSTDAAQQHMERFGEPRTLSAEIRSKLSTDSGASKREHVEIKKLKLDEHKKDNREYNAFYKNDDGVEVKQLVKDICEMMRTKNSKKQDVRVKLERLFELRLSNGDTFLHMTLCNNPKSLDTIVKIIHSMKMTHLLNLTNKYQQSILHLAIINDLPELVDLLVSKGCDPMLRDIENNTLIHYAVNCQTGLEPLLKAIKTHSVPCDLNACNTEKLTALHLAVLYNSPSTVKLLLQHGVDCNVTDNEDRTPLHLAAYDGYLPVLQVLLDFIDKDHIDAVDGRGRTALQIVCEGNENENALEMLKLLLRKEANPLKIEGSNRSAWNLVQDNPAMKEIMRAYIPLDAIIEEDVKSEPEDEYESADDGEEAESGLQGLSLYVRELSEALDASGTWKQLASRLHHDSLLNWYGSTPSPTRTLLNQIKECDESITSKSLVMILEEMGQKDVANIIKKYI